jgi:hypothetical protein
MFSSAWYSNCFNWSYIKFIIPSMFLWVQFFLSWHPQTATKWRGSIDFSEDWADRLMLSECILFNPENTLELISLSSDFFFYIFLSVDPSGGSSNSISLLSTT